MTRSSDSLAPRLSASRDPAKTDLPVFRFSTAGLPAGEASEAWRQIMARMFHTEKGRIVDATPQGGLSAFVLGDVMGNRSFFTAQRLTRDRRRIDATPDHLVLQLYRSGGFAGEMAGKPVAISRGQIAVCDLRRGLDVEAVTSDTIGLTIPRHLLDGVDLESLPPRLDPARERLLAARMSVLHHRLPELPGSEVAQVTADLLAAVRRLLDPSVSARAMEARELAADLVTLAEHVIAGELASPGLDPETIAERLRVSRATLYRVFEPLGGVMHHVFTMRLQALRAALDLPATPRTLTRLAADYGFKSEAHLSRSFRARYGLSPRDWRARQAAGTGEDWYAESVSLNARWHALGT